jgi:pantetheine-phosphate adenylyltransferase
MTKVVIPGTFDPPTVGHEWVINTASKIFDEVVVVVAYNPSKPTPLLSPEQRVEAMKAFAGDNVTFMILSEADGMLVDLMDEIESEIIVRGVRDGVDINYESVLGDVNASLSDDRVKTILIQCPVSNRAISSSLVRQLYKQLIDASDSGSVSRFAITAERISSYVPDSVDVLLRRKFDSRNNGNI